MPQKNVPPPDLPAVRADNTHMLSDIESIAEQAKKSKHPIDQALERGWRLIRLHGPEAKCQHPGKQPVDKEWQNLPGLTAHEAHAWLECGGNLGVICGERSYRLLGVDIDGEKPEGLTPTPTVRTSRGWHFYYVLPEGVELPVANPKDILPGVDIRYTGGQLVYPGSVHPETGVVYEWEPGLSPDDVELTPVPQFIIDAIREKHVGKALKSCVPVQSTNTLNGTNLRYARATLQGACEDVAAAQPGTRNSTLSDKAIKLGGLIGSGNLVESEVVEALLSNAPIAEDFKRDEVQRTIQKGIARGKKRPLSPPPPRLARTCYGGSPGYYVHIPLDHLTIDEAFVLIPVSRHLEAAVADYLDAISIGVAIREITSTLGRVDAQFDEDMWAPWIEEWSKRYKKNPVSMLELVAIHWPKTAYGHTSRLLAAVWAWRKMPEMPEVAFLRYPRWRMAATFCVRLQQVWGLDGCPPLAGETLSDVIRDFFLANGERPPAFGPRTARNTLYNLEAKGILEIVEHGWKGNPNKFKITETFRKSVSPEECLTLP